MMGHALPVFVAVVLVFWAVAGQPQTARATELRAMYGVYLESTQRASDEAVWSCPVGPCTTTGGVNASVELDQWGHDALAEATPRTLRADDERAGSVSGK